MNNVVKHETDLFKKYNDMVGKDRATTESSRLTEDQKDTVSKALNGIFANPKFKMKHFVTSGQITPYSTIRQYMLELRALEEQFESYEKGIKKQELEVEILELKIESEQDTIKKKEFQLQLIETQYNLRGNKRKAVQAHIEREQYLELIAEFNQLPEAKTPDGKLLMDIIGSAEEDFYEREYWMMRLGRMAAMDMSAYGRISAGNLDAIHQMPKEMGIQALAIAHKMNLQNENLDLMIKNEVQHKLLETDPNFKIEGGFNGVKLVENGPVDENKDDNEGLLDVYNN